MIFEFKTARNKMNGARKWLQIDTEKRTYTRFCPRMIVEGIEIKNADYKELLKQLKENGFSEVG